MEAFQDRAKSAMTESRVYFKKLKKRPPKNLDEQVQEIHQAVFKDIDCLDCAQCCKTTGPLFTEKDCQRIAKKLRITVAQFENDYLRVDEDGDKVLQQLPCPFLASDHACLIYEDRPKACREYPHTDRKKIYQIANLTLQNTLICPAAYRIVERMKSEIPVR